MRVILDIYIYMYLIGLVVTPTKQYLFFNDLDERLLLIMIKTRSHNDQATNFFSCFSCILCTCKYMCVNVYVHANNEY